MSEDFMHYLWQFRLYQPGLYTTTQGESLEIIHPGIPNTNSGPDFFNAKIKIDGTLWAGNVELHLKASDWFRHHHETDKAYNNVILHVILENDDIAITASGRPPVAWQMPIEETMRNKYLQLYFSSDWVACAPHLQNLSAFNLSIWLERILVEKLEYKMKRIDALLHSTQNNWDEVFFILLCRNFGFGINGDPFERLARNTPWTIIQKNRDDIIRLESLFLGQAGFLSNLIEEDEYTAILSREYKILTNKYNLKAIEPHHWKFMRLRPSNFPTIRLMQLAALFHKGTLTLDKVLTAETVEQLTAITEVPLSGYWQNHYRPNVNSKKTIKNLGKNSRQLIVINTLVPISFAYGRYHDQQSLCQKVLQWLYLLPPEQNALISRWQKQGIQPINAAQTQALVHLKQAYCQHKKCLHCKIGHIVLSKS